MPRRYAESFSLSQLATCALSLCVLALVSGCGSTPEVQSAPPPLPAKSVPSASPASTAAATPIVEPAPKRNKKSKKELEEEAATAALQPAVPVESPLPPEAVQQFERAVVLMSSGDTGAAEQALKSLAATYPAYSGPLLNLGILHAKAGRYDAAEKSLKAAIERKGDSALAFNQLGIVYRKLGRFKDADAAYRRAVEIDPNYALAWLNLGVLCDLYLQQPQRALEAYERYLAVASAPDQKVTGWVSELRKRLGNEPRSARADQ